MSLFDYALSWLPWTEAAARWRARQAFLDNAVFRVMAMFDLLESALGVRTGGGRLEPVVACALLRAYVTCLLQAPVTDGSRAATFLDDYERRRLIAEARPLHWIAVGDEALTENRKAARFVDVLENTPPLARSAECAGQLLSLRAKLYEQFLEDACEPLLGVLSEVVAELRLVQRAYEAEVAARLVVALAEHIDALSLKNSAARTAFCSRLLAEKANPFDRPLRGSNGRLVPSANVHSELRFAIASCELIRKAFISSALTVAANDVHALAEALTRALNRLLLEQERAEAARQIELEQERKRQAAARLEAERLAREQAAARYEAERLRQIELEQERQRQEAAKLEAERLAREEEAKNQRIYAACDRFVIEIDWYVRHRKDFVAGPSYWCPINAIVSNCGQRPSQAEVPRAWTLTEIVRARCRRSMSISQCGKFLQLNHLTPHREANQRRFGHFHCVKCNRRWFSANSWTDSWQKCVRCDVEVYPFQQDELKRSDGDDEGDDEGELADDKPHPMELCQRCQQLGRSCVVRYGNNN